jgi:hypothetical protein
MQSASILQLPIADLPVSTRFYRQSRRMGFETVGEMIGLGMNGLVQRPHFTWLWMSELLQLLKAYHLEELLQGE